MFAAGLENIECISTAKVGDKTLMDTLIPACDRAKSSDSPLPQLLADIADAAYEGAEYSNNAKQNWQSKIP